MLQGQDADVWVQDPQADGGRQEGAGGPPQEGQEGAVPGTLQEGQQVHLLQLQEVSWLNKLLI